MKCLNISYISVQTWVIFCCTRLELVVAVDVTDVVAFVLELVGKGLKKVATALATTLPNLSGLNEAIKTSNFLP